VSEILGEFFDLTGFASQFAPTLHFQMEIDFSGAFFKKPVGSFLKISAIFNLSLIFASFFFNLNLI
jgi:hypothetical protein